MIEDKKIISLEITQKLRAAIKKAAYQADMSVSAYIRAVLEKELNKK